MKFKNVFYLVLMASSIMSFSYSLNAAQTTVIEVFSEKPLNRRFRIPNTDIRYYDLDAPNRAEKLMPVFSNNQSVAEKQFHQWKESKQGQASMDKLKASYAPYLKAARYGITKIPAIVFDDGKYVVYGTLDVSQAVRDYDAYLKKTGKK